MLTYALRRATAGDADTLVRHRIRMFEDMGRMSGPDVDAARLSAEYREWVVRMMADDTYVSWVVEDHSPDATRTIVAGGGATIIPWPPGPVYPGARLAFVYNVYTEPEHRGRGVSRRIMDAVVAHPELQGLRRFMLATRDAHALYAKYGFQPLSSPERLMEVLKPNVYARGDAT